MKKIKKNKRKANNNLGKGGVLWYRKKIVDMVHKIEDEKYLNQILTILKKHIEKRGN